MKTKITALILALVMIISMLPVATGAGSYNRSKAVAYAKEHWKDEKGLCAEFVSDCLKAGGSNAWHTGVKGLLEKLKGQGTLYTVAAGTTKSSNWKLNKSACSFDVKPGDVLFFYCNTCKSAGKSGYCHAAIIIGFDSKGNIVCAQHNGAIGYYDTIRGYGHTVNNNKHEGSVISLQIFHMNDDGSSISSLLTALPAPPSKVVTKWNIFVRDITGTSATLKVDVTCTPANIFKVGLEMGASSSNMKPVASSKVGSSFTNYTVKCDGSDGPKLTAGKTYYYRFYAERIDGKKEYSNTYNFTTKAGGGSSGTPTTPTVTNAVSKWTLSVSGITQTSATVRADITCTASKLSRVGLELGTSSSNMKSVASWSVGSVLNYCSVKCDGSEGPKLSSGTTYYYRFYVQRNDGQYEYSTTGNFTTKAASCSHTYGTGTVTANATCTTDGSIVYKCTKCGASKTEAVKAKGHTAQTVTGKAATCTETGLSDGTKCSVCNAVIKAQTTIPAKGHTPGEWTVTEKPFGGLFGSEEQRCKVCSEVLDTRLIFPDTEKAVTKWTLSVSEITESSATVRADITCTPSKLSRVGLMMGTTEANMKSVASWKVGSVLTFCSVKCDGSEADKLASGTKYYYKFYVLRNDGEYEYSDVGSFTTKSAACTNHTYDSGTVTVQPTCTAAGTIVYKCTKCGVTKTDTVSAKGHSSQTVPGKAATCTATGLTDGSKCSVCNAVITAQNTIPAKGHSAQTVPGKAATCTATGLTDGSKCSVCNAVITAQNTIPAKGHSAQTVPGKAATCTATGLTDGVKCSVCNAVITAQNTIPAKGHEAVTVPGYGVTCIATGLTDGSKCSVCNAVITAQTVIPAKGHIAGDWTLVKQPGPGENGREEQRCTVCSAVMASREIVASYTPGDVDKDGNITAADARIILRISVGLETADSATFAIADYNNDGTVTASDARSVLRKAVGLS